MDEVSFAIDEHKTTIPVLYKDCKIPFRLRRLQYLDARTDYAGAVRGSLRLLGIESGHATSQPMLMLDDSIFEKSSIEETKERALRQTPPPVAPAMDPNVTTAATASSPTAAAPARPVRSGAATPTPQPAAAQPAFAPIEPPALPPAAKPTASTPAISLTAVYDFKTRSKLRSYSPLGVLGSQWDRLTLNSDNTFALKQGKQTLTGTFSLRGTRLVLYVQGRKWTNTPEGNLQLGCEALSENGYWLVLHHQRKLDMPR